MVTQYVNETTFYRWAATTATHDRLTGVRPETYSLRPVGDNVSGSMTISPDELTVAQFAPKGYDYLAGP